MKIIRINFETLKGFKKHFMKRFFWKGNRSPPSLFDKKESVAIHDLLIIIKNVNGVTDLSNSGKDIDGHRFGTGPSHLQIFA